MPIKRYFRVHYCSTLLGVDYQASAVSAWADVVFISGVIDSANGLLTFQRFRRCCYTLSKWLLLWNAVFVIRKLNICTCEPYTLVPWYYFGRLRPSLYPSRWSRPSPLFPLLWIGWAVLSLDDSEQSSASIKGWQLEYIDLDDSEQSYIRVVSSIR